MASKSNNAPQKRKREADITKPNLSKPNGESGVSHDVDTSKPTALFSPSGGRTYTLTIALPGSIIANAKSHDAKTYLAGNIARALAVFCVDEVVIFDDSESPSAINTDYGDQYTAFSDPCHFLAHVLSYLETPPHLRKALFPMHPNLRTAGTLPSLDMPHHLRANEKSEYREGVTSRSTAAGTLVDVGFANHILLPDVQIPSSTRVTVQLSSNSSGAAAVAPSTPREDRGYYWGYTIRRCPSLSTVFTECPFDGGYDLSVGTSERGEALSSLDQAALPEYQHMLIVFGGVAGLETAARNDAELAKMGISPAGVGELFDHWVNVLPGQGSRTIRTEEAVWLGLMGLRAAVVGKPPR